LPEKNVKDKREGLLHFFFVKGKLSIFYQILASEKGSFLNRNFSKNNPRNIFIIFAAGKSYTTSSCELPQVRKEARVNGCSGAI
jgi:hypothetical protein